MAPPDQDHSHGSFVSRLVVHAENLNHNDPQFPSCSAGFLDVIALSKTGIVEDRVVKRQMWRLDLTVHHRGSHVAAEPQNTALVITISDPMKSDPVYDEMVIQMNNLGWATSDLLVATRLRP